MRASLRGVLVLLHFLAVQALFAQQNCPLPPAVQAIPANQNIFSDQQEIDLGDALAESLAQSLRIIDKDPLNSYLRGIGDRLVEQLPPTKLKFRVYLIELSEANAFSIAGGRIYVSRKMVALARNEDELAGVLAHELGHIVTHQTAIEMTKAFRAVLGATQVGDRADIFEKLHQFKENAARLPSSHGTGEGKEQYIADAVSLYTMARAGYSPQSYQDLWDRFQETHGKTGNWFSEMFGSTKPSEKRLREMAKVVQALPVECARRSPAAQTKEFATWQSKVIEYGGEGGEESLPGLLSKEKLALPLRPDITNLHFSPDGKYLLAQDEGGIHVLSRDPFAFLFYIWAPGAYDAVFSPDSQSIVFHNPALRVEVWSVPGRKRLSTHELALRKSCLQSSLAPDGSVIACLDEELTLSLIDVASGTMLTTKKNFFLMNLSGAYFFLEIFRLKEEGLNPAFINMGFSPDGHYFLAGHSSSHLAFDLVSRKETSFPGSIKEITSTNFAFIGPDRMAGIDRMSPSHSPVVKFPSGERIDRLALNNELAISPAAHGNFLVMSGLPGYAEAVFDVTKKQVAVAVKLPAVDIYDTIVVYERLNGELALESIETRAQIAAVQLPEARLGRLRAASVSPDLTWLALSNRTRGAVWDLPHNIRVQHLRAFHGAWFGDDENFYLDFPKWAKTDRTIARLIPNTGDIFEGYKLGEVSAYQYGGYVVITTRKNKSQYNNQDNVDVEIRDVRNGNLVWTHHFPHEIPSISPRGNRVVLGWSLSTNAAHDEVQRFPELKSQVDKNDYLCEVVDMNTNEVAAKTLVRTNNGSFRVKHASQYGNWLIVEATGNQVMTYSMDEGEEKGHVFGSYPQPSLASGLLMVENEEKINLYELAGMQLRRQYSFSSPVSFKAFSRDGKRLLVLTEDQTLYTLDASLIN